MNNKSMGCSKLSEERSDLVLNREAGDLTICRKYIEQGLSNARVGMRLRRINARTTK